MPRLQNLQNALVRVAGSLSQLTRTAGSAAWRGTKRAARTMARALTSDRLWNALRPLFSLARVAAVALCITAATLAALRVTVRTIPPTEIGVLQRGWGGSAGVVPRDLGPRKVFVLPGRDTLHLVDRGTHYLRFGLESEGNEHPSLTLRTTDDLDVHLGVSIPYRVVVGDAHRLVSEGLVGSYRVLARTTIERVLLDTFSELSRDDWSSPSARRAAEGRALASATVALAKLHVRPLGVHVTATWFPPQYEVEVMEQKLLEQRIQTDAMLARLDEKQHELDVAKDEIDEALAARSAELDLEIDAARFELQAAVHETRAEATEYEHGRRTDAQNRYAKLVAEGELALAQAEALRERLTNEALESDGGRLMLARDAAKSLKVTSVKLDANNPSVPSFLDLGQLTELLIGK